MPFPSSRSIQNMVFLSYIFQVRVSSMLSSEEKKQLKLSKKSGPLAILNFMGEYELIQCLL